VKENRPYSSSEQDAACRMRPFYLASMAHDLISEAQNKKKTKFDE
jgi:hypothetical protein